MKNSLFKNRRSLPVRHLRILPSKDCISNQGSHHLTAPLNFRCSETQQGSKLSSRKYTQLQVKLEKFTHPSESNLINAQYNKYVDLGYTVYHIRFSVFGIVS